MAVYKVIQDIEAEDKILGPLTLKSFVYALIAGGLAFVSVRLALSELGDAKWAIILILLPPIILFGVLAAPIGKDQPTEVWILSHLRFFTQSHKRVWDQTGMSELVTITVPKKIEKQLTKTFSQDEVHSRLKALAATLDSHGWAVKNVTTDIYGQPDYFLGGKGDSDRLVGASTITQPQQVLDIRESDDIMDEQSNQTAQNFSQLMQKADDARRQALQNLIKNPPAPSTVDYRFLDTHSALTPGTDGSTFVGTSITTPLEQSDSDHNLTTKPHLSSASSDELGDPSLHDKHPHFETKPSLADEQRQAMEAQQPTTRQTPQNQTAQPPAQNLPENVKKELADSNDLKVASVAQLANHHETVRQIGPNEVEITLH